MAIYHSIMDALEAAMNSDTNGTEVVSSTAVPTSLTASSAIDVRNFREIDFIIYLTNATNVSQVDMVVEFSEKASPSVDADWVAIKTDNVTLTTGESSLKDYTPQQAVSGATTFGISAPVRGRWMRIKYYCSNGTAVGSAASINAYRRK